MEKTTFLDTTLGMCETWSRPSGTLEEFRKADDKLEGEEEIGERDGWRKGSVERGKGRKRRGGQLGMTGWERHSLHSIPGGESGKSQSSSGRNERSHFYVDKSVCLQGEAVTERGVSNTGVLSQGRKEICFGSTVALPLYSDGFEAC